MARNIEIKARIASIQALVPKVAAIADKGPIGLGRTRVHLDNVKDLGHFLELEVVLEEGELAEVGVPPDTRETNLKVAI